ncbi:MAG TPA: hypothetical protein DCP91_08450 [Eggerthellaceae bacterium]|nr:hypothetical protein [Eggerthellaceae bacterium]
MPTSNATRRLKIVAKVLVAIAFFALMNALLTFVLEPYGSRSQLAWQDYEKQKSLDTILVGTSCVEYGIDPAVINKACGIKSYNLASPSQSIEESFVGIRTAYEDHHITRAILGLSFNSLTSSTPPNPGSAYMHNRSLYATPLETFAVTNEFLWHYGAATSAYSLNFPFPWASNPIRSLRIPTLAENVKAKLEHADVAAMAERLESGWHYVGLGHGARKGTMDLNGSNVRQVNKAEDEEEVAGAAAIEDTATLDPDRERTIREICAYCDERGIDLLVIMPPLPSHDVFDRDSTYFETISYIEDLFADMGKPVYDFNLAEDDLYDLKPDYFADNWHCNLKGAQVYSRSFAKFLKAYMAGENVADLFMTPEQKYAELDYIAAVFAESSVQPDGVHLKWHAVASPERPVEYRVMLKLDNDADAADPANWKAVSDWSNATEIAYLPERQGVVKLRICARFVGSDAEYDRYRTVTEFW